MATITGLTAARMLAIEAASVVDGSIVGDNLILEKHDASTVDAGNVRGPQGVPADIGDLVFSARRTKALCLSADGAEVSRTTYASLFAAIVPSLGTGTVTIASPGVWTLNAHGLENGEAVYLTTTGALPTGLAQNTLYYVVNKATNTFQLSATRGGAAINTTGSQSGVHTVRSCPYGLGNGSTTFNVPNMLGRAPLGHDPLNASTATGHTAKYMGQLVGEETHVLTDVELAEHTHAINPTYEPINSGTTIANATAAGGYQNLNTGEVESAAGAPIAVDQPHNNLGPVTVGKWFVYAGV